VNECQPLTLDIKRRMIRTHQVSFSWSQSPGVIWVRRGEV